MITSPRSLMLFLVHSLRHELFNVPIGVPAVVGFDQAAGSILAGGTNLDLVVVGQMALASDVGEQVRYIAEIGFFGADVAVKGNVSRHGTGEQGQVRGPSRQHG